MTLRRMTESWNVDVQKNLSRTGEQDRPNIFVTPGGPVKKAFHLQNIFRLSTLPGMSSQRAPTTTPMVAVLTTGTKFLSHSIQTSRRMRE